MATTYDKASLVLIPSGTKEGTIFSQKPTNGDGDFTFSRSTSATRVGPSGYIEKERTNYVRYSQDFSQWSILGGATITTGVTDPNGGSTAATISNIGAGSLSDGIAIFNNPMTIGAGSVVSQSIYLKGSGTIAIAMERGVSGTYFFYQKTITLTSTWQRFDNFQQIGSAADGFHFYVANYTGTTATSVDIAFAQFEFGTAPSEYIATTTSAVTTGITDNIPRLDYTDSSCPSLLLEPQRTNLITQSEFTGGYIKSNVTATSNQATSPDGLNNATEIETTDTAQCHMRTTFTAATGNYVGSVFVKKQDFDYIYMEMGGAYAWFNIDSGALGNGNNYGSDWTYVDHSIEDYGNGWYRCILVGNCLTAGSYSFRSIQPVPSNGTYNSGLSGGITYWYGAQVESGSYATSYIPTYGSAAVTRNQDVCSVTGVSDLIGQTEGTIFVDVDFETLSGTNMFVSIRPDVSNKIEVYRDINTIYGETASSSSFNFSASSVTVGRYKIAFAYSSGSSAMYINGVLVGSNTTPFAFTSTLDDIYINSRGGSSFIEQAKHKQAILFKTRLTNEELAALTTI